MTQGPRPIEHGKRCGARIVGVEEPMADLMTNGESLQTRVRLKRCHAGVVENHERILSLERAKDVVRKFIPQEAELEGIEQSLDVKPRFQAVLPPEFGGSALETRIGDEGHEGGSDLPLGLPMAAFL